MSEQVLLDWLKTASPSQFFLGITVLALGSSKLLSEKNVSESLGGVFLPVRWLVRWIREKRESAVVREVTELRQMGREISRLREETAAYHHWSVIVTSWHRSLELWAAQHGLTLPHPPLIQWHEYTKKPERKEDDDDYE